MSDGPSGQGRGVAKRLQQKKYLFRLQRLTASACHFVRSDSQLVGLVVDVLEDSQFDMDGNECVKRKVYRFRADTLRARLGSGTPRESGSLRLRRFGICCQTGLHSPSLPQVMPTALITSKEAHVLSCDIWLPSELPSKGT